MNVRVPSSFICERRPGAEARGFTLIELMITLVVLALVVGALATVLMNASHSKDRTAQNLEATQTVRSTLDMISKDVRCAGYGSDIDNAQPAIAYVDSTQIIICENQMPYPDPMVGHLGPVAYDPNASPKPQPLVGTQWTPPMKYHTGAELVRYTLDLNDDGVVDANDLATPAGADARATPNPNDYVLVREVYGDSTGNLAGNNGGAQERVALVYKPGNGVPPLFTVYMKGQTTPWNWSNGPVPANKLQSIDRVTVQVTASSARPDNRGHYPSTTLRTEVNAMRNSPNSTGVPQYLVYGYIFNDVNGNGTYQSGVDQPLSGARVQLGTSWITYTNSSGYYQFRAPSGTYTIRHVPPMGYASAMSPDTFTVNVASSAVRYDFADSARSGGWVTIHVWNDANGNGVEDSGETPMFGVVVALGTFTGATDANGNVRLFSPPGNWSALATMPDSMSATTPNPVTGTITNGGTASAKIGLEQVQKGDVVGTVYKDLNRNGNFDSGETGIPNVWVGVTRDNGVTVLGFGTTDASGKYDVKVPANDPPRTSAYTVYVVPPTGYFPTGPTATGGVFVQANNNTSPYNFGMANYQVITLNAQRVLSLAATDLMEKDWTGNQTAHAHGDQDLILGADAGGTDQVSVWFNYAASGVNPFSGTPDRSWSAPQAVLAIATDTLDANVAPFARPDLVTGTRYTPTGNFFVWYTQNSSGNEGYFPSSPSRSYTTADAGDVQAVATLDVLGGDKPDIIVGTKSPTANQGSVELWTNDNSASPTFSRAETYSSFGVSTLMGEVTAIKLVDLNNDGLKDMVVATKTGSYSGQVLYYQNMGKLAVGNHFVLRQTVTMSGMAATALASTDVDGDGYRDIIVGTQNGTSTGSLIYLKNNGVWGFGTIKVVNAPGIVLSMAAADMGGAVSVKDLIVGWRGSTSDYSGGVTVYYLDSGVMPDTGVDPSGGAVTNMVPAIATANFNWWAYPSGAPTPALTDLAIGVKQNSSAGQLWVFIR